MKYVNVSFLSTKDQEGLSSYTYKDTLGTKKYDAVLVPTRYGASIAIVVKDDIREPEYAVGGIKEVKEIISSKYVDDYTKSLKIKDLEKKLEKETKKLDKLSTYKVYANANKDFAKLLAEYENLIK